MNYEIRPHDNRVKTEDFLTMNVSLVLGLLFEDPNVICKTLLSIAKNWVYDLDNHCYVDDPKKIDSYIEVQIAVLGIQEFLDRIAKKVNKNLESNE